MLVRSMEELINRANCSLKPFGPNWNIMNSSSERVLSAIGFTRYFPADAVDGSSHSTKHMTAIAD
jgi:hypothetical protein